MLWPRMGSFLRTRVGRLALLATLAAAAVAIALPVAGSHAQTPPGVLRVTTTSDHDDGSCTAQDCTLREGLKYGSAQSVVSVPAGHYRLTRGPLQSGGSLGVVGTDTASTTIDGGKQTQVLQVTGGTLGLLNVTITGGGGSNAVNGGGIVVNPGATLSLVNSRVTGNTASSAGGGIYSQGSVGISASTIDDNHVLRGSGGGIFVQPPPGAPGNASLQTIDTTISGNTAASGGSGIFADASLFLLSTTIAGNANTGVQLGTTATANFRNTILAAGPQGFACAGPVPAGTSSGHDIVSDASCGLADPTDRSSVDPQLGPLADNGGPTPTQALLAGSPAIDAGDDQFCPGTDQRGAARPHGAHCDIGAFEFGATPPTRHVPPPTFNKTFNAEPTKGVVKVKVPGSSKFVTLAAGAQLPKGTTVDTTKGRMTLTSADKKRKKQHADFYQGVFKIKGQTKGRKPITLLDLAGPKPQCGTAKKGSADITRKRRHKSRHLWGSGKGRFRTRGQYSSATVRGTIWLTQDTCKGTLVKVKRGVVSVKDFTRHKTFKVKAGHQHLSRPPHRRP